MRRSMLFAVAAILAAAHVPNAVAANLISNGDFQSGNTGFTSDYSYNTLNSGPELVEGAYSVVEKAADVHFAWLSNFYDHTLGTSSGRYFVANASHELRTPLAIIIMESPAIIAGAASVPPLVLRATVW